MGGRAVYLNLSISVSANSYANCPVTTILATSGFY